MNSVQLVGRLTRDVDMRYSTGENASAIARFAVAVNRNYKNSEGKYEADFPNVIAFGKTAEFVNNHFKKGDPIGINGRIQTGSYVNKDGNRIYTTDVIADGVEFVGNKSDGEVTTTNRNSYKANPIPDMNIPDGLDEDTPWS